MSAQMKSVSDLMRELEAAKAALKAAKAQQPKSVAEQTVFTDQHGRTHQIVRIVDLRGGVMPEKINSFNSFSFGLSKARKILAHLPEIRAFVEAMEQEGAAE